MKRIIVLIFISAFIINACQKQVFLSYEPVLPQSIINYKNVSLPNHFPSHDLGEFSNEQITLGRVLFYDRAISISRKVSCGSCHSQQLGFADDSPFSDGFGAHVSLRNSSSLSNLFGYSSFFWDARTSSLEELIFQPIENHVEMGFTDTEGLLRRIENTEYYDELFEDAFGDTNVSKERITKSLSAFLNALISKDSKYDEGMSNEFSNYNAQERMGLDIFQMNCESCHFGSNLGGNGLTANIGLDRVYEDIGVGEWLGESSNGEFKVPGLRNVMVSGPYMHDGRFQTIDEVIDHYSSGIQAHENLNWRLAELNIDPLDGPGIGWWEPPNGGAPRPLNLNESEKIALKAFLNTLTDGTYLMDAKFSDPFEVVQ